MKYIKLISDFEHDEHVVFTDTIGFKINTDGYGERAMEQLAERRLNEICAWCSETFQHNFVIMEHVDTRIVGGWADNRAGWKTEGMRVRRQDYAWQARYELRCFSQDAVWFRTKWA